MERSTSVGLGLGEKRKERDEGGGGGGGGDLVGLNPLHPFYCTSGGVTGDFYEGARVCQPYSSPYKAPVMPMRVFPFTSAQWQELQRQALIYKHIMASVPVPPDLLFPLSARAFPEAPPFVIPSTVVHGVGNCVAGFNLRFSNSTDPEPGRCRRTDGKKWRCSRDAAPDQKYCERHVHRGRPRSRKPVELRNKNNNDSNNSKSVASATPVDTDMITVNRSNASSQTTGLLPKLDLKLPFQSVEPTKDTRYQGNLASNQQWVQQQYQDLPNLNYSSELNHRCCPFLNPDLSAFEENAVAGNEPPPRSFIDAWSTKYASAAATTNPTETMPTLTLSMSNNANGIEDEIKMGLGLAVKSMNWTGGPLAEVLQSTSNMTSPSGSSKCCSCVDPINLMCKGCCEGGQEVSPRDSPSQVAASPSGVLHKALVSLSDSSSSSSSPTFAAVASRPEVAFQWLNQSK